MALSVYIQLTLACKPMCRAQTWRTTALIEWNAVHIILALGVWQVFYRNIEDLAVARLVPRPTRHLGARLHSCYFPPEQSLLMMLCEWGSKPVQAVCSEWSSEFLKTKLAHGQVDITESTCICHD